ncbi:Uncharacterised protein [Mycobacterium tuberculosis]|nr:Uncharacterised protein [Mycobacterium tuberculosis]
MDLVQAQVVPSTFEQGELRSAGERIGERIYQLGQVTIDELTLQSDLRRRHHDRRVVAKSADDRGNQIRQRLAGSGAGLDHQVLTGFKRMRYRGGHLLLAATPGAAKCRHGDGKQLRHRHGYRLGHGTWSHPCADRACRNRRLAGCQFQPVGWQAAQPGCHQLPCRGQAGIG